MNTTLIICFFILLLQSNAYSACVYWPYKNQPYTIGADFDACDIIFVGTVVSLKNINKESTLVNFKVTKLYKGEQAQDITVSFDPRKDMNNQPYPDFQAGGQYLISAYRGKNNIFELNECASKELSQANDMIKTLGLISSKYQTKK